MKTKSEHMAESERLLRIWTERRAAYRASLSKKEFEDSFLTDQMQVLQAAQVHATLAEAMNP